MVVTWGYVWTLGWVCDSIPCKVVNEIVRYVGDVQMSVVLMQTHSLHDHTSLLLLNRAAKLL